MSWYHSPSPSSTAGHWRPTPKPAAPESNHSSPHYNHRSEKQRSNSTSSNKQKTYPNPPPNHHRPPQSGSEKTILVSIIVSLLVLVLILLAVISKRMWYQNKTDLPISSSPLGKKNVDLSSGPVSRDPESEALQPPPSYQETVGGIITKEP